MHFPEDNPAWRETNVEDTDLEAVISDLLEGQYSNPVRVVGFNLSEGWVRDVSEEIARKLRQRCADERHELRIRCISSSRGPHRSTKHVNATKSRQFHDMLPSPFPAFNPDRYMSFGAFIRNGPLIF